jgi:hypothetical protein
MLCRILIAMVWFCWLLVLSLISALHRSLQHSIKRVQIQEELNNKLGEVTKRVASRRTLLTMP